MGNAVKALKGDNDSYAILQILMDDGSRITDKRAMKVGTEVLSDAMGGIEVPLRKPTPSYEHRHYGRRPETRGAVQVETADVKDPDKDSRFVLKVPMIFQSAVQGLDPTLKKNEVRFGFSKHLIAVLAMIFLMGSGLFFGLHKSNEAEFERERQTLQQTAAPPNQVLDSTGRPVIVEEPPALNQVLDATGRPVIVEEENAEAAGEAGSEPSDVAGAAASDPGQESGGKTPTPGTGGP